jgi:hypothetical protein
VSKDRVALWTFRGRLKGKVGESVKIGVRGAKYNDFILRCGCFDALHMGN